MGSKSLVEGKHVGNPVRDLFLFGKIGMGSIDRITRVHLPGQRDMHRSGASVPGQPALNAGRLTLTSPVNLYIYTYTKKESILAHIRLTEFRQNIATHFDNVIASRAPLLVTRQGSEALVLMAEGEYESMQETLHLLSTPANSERLRESMAQLRRGEMTEKDPTL
jgi:antitoxin YefM